MPVDASAPATRLQLLGRFEARAGDTVIDLKPASQRLLAYLALADRQVERAHTAFRLWPDKPEPRALANLRSALWRLRRQPAPLIETTSTHVRLHHEVWVDARDGVAEFCGADATDLLGWTEPHDLIAGELLPDWYDDWLILERERLRQVRLSSLERSCRRLIDAGRWADAINVGLRALSLEPLRESAHRLVIEAHLGQGNTCEAIRQLRSCARLLDAELGVAPTQELVALIPSPHERLEHVRGVQAIGPDAAMNLQ